MPLLLSLALVSISASAQEDAPLYTSVPGESLEAYNARTKWFGEAKLGVFICWGPCSIAEGEIGWSRNGPRPGRAPAGGGVPLEVYDNLYKEFSPTQFDPDHWADVVAASGARYVIFLTKHHDGFAMFDSALTEYKITNSPYGRDVTGELAEALRKRDVRIVWYYSQPDWYHPDYRTENHDRYTKYLHGQIRELCTKYGKIDGIWFDGLGGSAEDWDSERLFAMIHELQPGVIINNRAGVPGDFVTPEQQVGRFSNAGTWESCITMGVGWSFRGAHQPTKSLRECLHILIRCAGGGGNLALDTGPMPDGRIEPRHEANYRVMGEWLAEYGESIYATQGGPYMPAAWGVSTSTGNTAYLHVLEWPEGDLVLPALGANVLKATALTGGTPHIEADDDQLVITLAAGDRDEVDTIIKLELDRPAAELNPISLRYRHSLTFMQPARASGEWSGDYAVGAAVDGDEGTRWGAEPESTSGWIEVDLGEAKTFDRALVLEEQWNRTQSYRIEYRVDDEWRTAAEGETLGNALLEFEPVTARRVRLNIIEANEVPTLWEFHVFPPGARVPEMVTGY